MNPSLPIIKITAASINRSLHRLSLLNDPPRPTHSQPHLQTPTTQIRHQSPFILAPSAALGRSKHHPHLNNGCATLKTFSCARSFPLRASHNGRAPLAATPSTLQALPTPYSSKNPCSLKISAPALLVCKQRSRALQPRTTPTLQPRCPRSCAPSSYRQHPLNPCYSPQPPTARPFYAVAKQQAQPPYFSTHASIQHPASALKLYLCHESATVQVVVKFSLNSC